MNWGEKSWIPAHPRVARVGHPGEEDVEKQVLRDAQDDKLGGPFRSYSIIQFFNHSITGAPFNHSTIQPFNRF